MSNGGVPGFPSCVQIAATSGAGPPSCIGWLLGNASLSRSGGSSASASSGAGGWQVTDRTRQKAATEWLDYYPLVQSMKLRFDGNIIGVPQADATDVEAACAVLEAFELPVAGSNPPLPPILTLLGPVLHTDLFWVCSRLEFSGADGDQIRDDNGIRTVQVVTLELTEYSPSTAISTPLSAAQLAVQGSQTLGGGPAAGQTTVTASGQTYTVVAGDTLQSIAANVLSNASLWTQIALLNGLPNGAILTPGTVLQLPAA